MLRKVLLGLGVLGLAAGAGAWMLLQPEPIPAELPPLPAEPRPIVIPGTQGASDLDFASLRGKTVFFVLVGAWTAGSTEGVALDRALNRWIYPPSTEGFIIGDARGLGLFGSRIEASMDHFAREQRFPLYVDYEGVFAETFALPRGHHGFVVLGPAGEVLHRHSGDVPPETLGAIAEDLGAREPAGGPPAPAFEVGGVDREACRSRPCLFVFLGEPVGLEELPGGAGRFEGSEAERRAQLQIPKVRNLAMARRLRVDEPAIGVLVGRAPPEVELDGWRRAEDEDGAAARALGVDPGAPAVVLVEGGAIAFSASGVIPLYQWGFLADRLGSELDDRSPPNE